MKQLDERQLIDLWGERIEAAQIKTQLAMERIASALEKIEKLCGPYPGEPDTLPIDASEIHMSFDLLLWRKHLGWTQEKAASMLGIALRTYSERERTGRVSRECALACANLEQAYSVTER